MKTNYFLILFCNGYSTSILCMENSQPHNNRQVRKALSQQLYVRRPRIFTLEDAIFEQKSDNNTDNSPEYMAMLDQWSENLKKQALKRSQSNNL